MLRAKVIGTGSYAPKRVLTNFDLEKMVSTSSEWIIQRTGIRERHLADGAEVTSDLAAKAAMQALDRAGVEPEEVELIVCGTTSADMQFPSTGVFVQHKIGAKQAGAFDVWAACTGSLYSLSIGAQFIQTGKYRTVLCVGAELLSRITDYTDRGTCILLGDAAGAAVLRPSEDHSGIVDIELAADGQYWELLYGPGGGSKYPATHETVNKRLHYVKMKGNEVFKVAVRAMGDCTAGLLAKHGIHPADVDLFIPHQANMRIIQALAKRLDFPMEKVYVNIDRYGNTGAASIYVALDEAVQLGRLKTGDLLLFAAFGGGFTWGAGLVRW